MNARNSTSQGIATILRGNAHSSTIIGNASCGIAGNFIVAACRNCYIAVFLNFSTNVSASNNQFTIFRINIYFSAITCNTTSLITFYCIYTIFCSYIKYAWAGYFNAIIIALNVISFFSSSCNSDGCICPTTYINTFIMAGNLIVLRI